MPYALVGTTLDADPVPSPVPPSTGVNGTRIERRLRYRGGDRRMHTLTLRNLVTVDDILVNMSKAFLFSVETNAGYSRPETSARLRETLVRTNLVF